MSIVDGVFGILATMLTTIIVYNQFLIFRHFEHHEDVSMDQFFTSERAPYAFTVVAVTSFVYAMTLFVSTSETLLQEPRLGVISQIGTLLVLSGFGYFFYLIAQITEQPET